MARPFLPALLWAVVLAIAVAPLYARAELRWPSGKTLWLPLLFTLALGLAVLVPLALGIVQAAREASELRLWLASARAYGVPEPAWIASLPFRTGGSMPGGLFTSALPKPRSGSSVI